MAVVGDAWGTREEMLHPRDANGRFRSKWKMAISVVDKLMSMLGSFSPKTFGNDDEAGNYVQSLAKSGRPGAGSNAALSKFLRGTQTVQTALRRGDTAGPDVKGMDNAMAPLPDDLILSRVVGPEAFGLTPESIAQIEEYTGHLVADKGYAPTNIGTPLPHAGPAITITIAAPAGTRAAIPQANSPHREVILDRDQPLRITKVDPDGRGGFYVLAVATEKGGIGQKRPVKLGGKAPTPEPGLPEPGQVAPAPGTPEAPGAPVSVAPVPGTPAAPLVPQKKIGRPAGPAPAPRNDGHVAEAIGGKPVPQTPQAQEAVPEGAPEPIPQQPGLPKTPAPDARSTFRGAFKKADITSPSEGKRRQQFNEAYLGAATGKKTPQEAVDGLENHIALNEKILQSDKEDDTDSGPLPDDIKKQKDLVQLIKDHFQLEGASQKEDKAVRKAAPAAKKAAPAAPKKEAPKNESMAEAPTRLNAEEGARVAKADAAIAKGERERKAAIRKETRAKKPAAPTTPTPKLAPRPKPTAEDEQAKATEALKHRQAMVDRRRPYVKVLQDFDFLTSGLGGDVDNETLAERIEQAVDLQLDQAHPDQHAMIRNEVSKIAKDVRAGKLAVARRRVTQLMGDYDLELGSRAGKKTKFDPKEMKLLSGKAEPGDTVTVNEPAVIYRHKTGAGFGSSRAPSEPMVLERAVVFVDEPAAVKKVVVPKAASVEPSRATTKGHGGPGVKLYYGAKAKPNAEPERALITVSRQGVDVVNADTGKRIDHFGAAFKYWATPVSPLNSESSAPEVKKAAPKAPKAPTKAVPTWEELGKPQGPPPVGVPVGHEGGRYELLPGEPRRYRVTNEDGKDISDQVIAAPGRNQTAEDARTALRVEAGDLKRTRQAHDSGAVAVWDSIPGSWSYESGETKGFQGATAKQKQEIRTALSRWTAHKSTTADTTRQAEPTVNAALRGSVPLGADVKADIAALDLALDLSRTKKPITVHRGVSNGEHILPDNWQTANLAGLEWSTKGYTPTTGNIEAAEAYVGHGKSRGFMMRIQLPRGASAVAIRDAAGGVDDEGEVVLPRGLTFRVVKDNGPQGEFKLRQLDVEISATKPELPLSTTKTPTPSAPEKASGTAKGKLTAARIAPGTRILVRKDAKGDWAPTSTKTGATPITVTSKDASTAGGRRGSMRRSGSAGYVITGKDDDGNEITVKAVTPSQTFWLHEKKEPKLTKAAARDKQFKEDAEVIRNFKDDTPKLPAKAAPKEVVSTDAEVKVTKASPAKTVTIPTEYSERKAKAKTGRPALLSAPGRVSSSNTYPVISGPAYKDMTPAERKKLARSISQYRSNFYSEINSRLRGEKPRNPHMDELVHDIDDAIGHSELKSDVVVHRGIRRPEDVFGDKWSDQDVTGMEWQDPAYTSTSAAESVAVAMADDPVKGRKTPGVVMNILVPKGAHGIQGSPAKMGDGTEAELLLARGGKFRVVADHGIIDGHRRLDVEMLDSPLPERLEPSVQPESPFATPKKRAAPTAKLIEAPTELQDLVAKTSITDLRAQAKEAGIKVPASARTKQQIVDHIAQALAERELMARLSTEPIKGEAVLAATPATLTRSPRGHSGDYTGESLDAPEGAGSVRALSEYEGVEYDLTNKFLRGQFKDPNTGEPVTGNEDYLQGTPERIAEIDKTMKVSRLTSDVELHRGIKNGLTTFGDAWTAGVIDLKTKDLDEQDRQYERWQAGERPDLTGLKFTDLGFVSTTADPNVADDFVKTKVGKNYGLEGEPVVMSIIVPKGTGGVQLAEWGHAAEILLERGLSFEVVADHGVDAKGYRRLDVKVVPK